MLPPKVSVIIPVYKAEAYIARCVESLFSQTLDEVEYIFVDDCSPDRSIEIVEDILITYPNRRDQVMYVTHSNNLGVGKARFNGIGKATGEFIIHCDPDDWIDKTLYEDLFQTAMSEDADIVCCGYVEEFNKYSIKKTIKNTSIETVDFLSSIFEGEINSALWNKLVRRRVYEEVNLNLLPYLSLWEDMYVTTALVLKAKKIVLVDNVFYHYTRTNNISIVSLIDHNKIDSKIRSVIGINDKVCRSMHSQSLFTPIMHLKLRAKEELLSNPLTYDVRKWKESFPEANKYVWNLNIPIIRKLTLIMASHGFSMGTDILNWIRNRRLFLKMSKRN